MLKKTLKTWAISFILFTLAVMYYMALTNNISVEIPSNLVVSAVIAVVPSIVFALSVHFSAKYMREHETRKAAWKIPIILLIVFAVFLVLFTAYTALTCYGEECMGAAFLVFYGPPAIIAFTLVFSLLPSLAFRYTDRKRRRCCLYAAIALIVIFAVLIILTYFTCNFGYDPNCLSYKAFKSENYDICEKASTALTRDRCYIQIAQQTLSAELCSKVTMQDECIQDIENMISSRQRGPIPLER